MPLSAFRPGSGRRALLGVLLLAATPLACDSDTSPTENVPIMRDVGTMIVYGTSQNVDVPALRDHCQALDGMFNECGTICAPDAGACPTVCAFTCEKVPR
jgi:hypothetical protein